MSVQNSTNVRSWGEGLWQGFLGWWWGDLTFQIDEAEVLNDLLGHRW